LSLTIPLQPLFQRASVQFEQVVVEIVEIERRALAHDAWPWRADLGSFGRLLFNTLVRFREDERAVREGFTDAKSEQLDKQARRKGAACHF